MENDLKIKFMKTNIGFMQGRLSPIINGRIQAFPWETWEEEFFLASKIGINIMEWTLDQERLYENPLLNEGGQKKIKSLCNKYNFFIPSLTGDCFMQAPFWKAIGEERIKLKNDFLNIVSSASLIGIRIIVIPLVDNGAIENDHQEDVLINFLKTQETMLLKNKIKISFESDFAPTNLLRFINRLDSRVFGINYDIGNSASLGFNPKEEFGLYGKRINNVHVKDRLLGGPTVPLGKGNANFHLVFNELKKQNYSGNLIMQTARASNGNHSEILKIYMTQINDWKNDLTNL